jgi:hypothetical protein
VRRAAEAGLSVQAAVAVACAAGVAAIASIDSRIKRVMNAARIALRGRR